MCTDELNFIRVYPRSSVVENAFSSLLLCFFVSLLLCDPSASDAVPRTGVPY